MDIRNSNSQSESAKSIIELLTTKPEFQPAFLVGADICNFKCKENGRVITININNTQF